MPSIIQKLDDQTINQIAAGEVVENPASCLKELIENALDAQAQNIRVEVVAAGRKKMSVADDGVGMSFEDARLALERHATSKIKNIQDMDQILSMGFRGEALPSIASISKLSLWTSQGQVGTQLICQGGKILSHEAAAHTKGTLIEIESLFYNVPARKEFQKSLSQDNRDIYKVVMQLAIANPTISFRLVQDHQEVFNLKYQSSLDELENLHFRIEKLFGKALSQDLIRVDFSTDGIHLKGYIAHPKNNRPNRLGQYLFINKRVVTSYLVSQAVQDGYSTRLQEARFPIYFLHLELDPQKIDVNVHPQKKEIRFKDPFEIKKQLSTWVDKALNPQKSSSSIETPVVRREVFFEHSVQNPFIKNVEYSDFTFSPQLEQPLLPEQLSLDSSAKVVGIFESYLFIEAASLSHHLSLNENESDGLIMMHTKRAHERILYEKLLQKEGEIAIQNLMLAETITLPKEEALLILENLSLLNELGISIRSLKDQTFIIDGLAPFLSMQDVHQLIENLVEQVQLMGRVDSNATLAKEKIAQAICSAAHQPKIVNENEAVILIQKLFKCEKSQFSPHGKPIFVPLSLGELKRKFN